jgi:uncharacterized protein YndB with AHSA1/START domain
MDKLTVTKDLENKTLILERTFAAPAEKLWRAYSDKDWFTKWWGPQGWETTVKEFDFAPGGRNLYGMKCVDQNQGDFFGQESWGLMEYETIDEPRGFTYKDFFANPDGSKQENMPGVSIEIELRGNDESTTLVTRCIGETAEDIEKLIAMGMAEGFNSSADKLEELVTA